MSRAEQQTWVEQHSWRMSCMACMRAERIHGIQGSGSGLLGITMAAAVGATWFSQYASQLHVAASGGIW